MTSKLNEHVRNSTTALPLKRGKLSAPELAKYYIALDKAQGWVADEPTKTVLKNIARDEEEPIESVYITGLPVIGDVLLTK